MARAVWKGPFVDGYLLKQVQELNKSGSRQAIRTWSRRSTIIPQFVGINFAVHNGRKFISITISEDMVGHKLGEFSPTRQFPGHTPADKKAKQETAVATTLPKKSLNEKK